MIKAADKKLTPEKDTLQVLVKQKLYFAAALLRQYQQLQDPLPGDQEGLLQSVAWHLVTTVDAFSHELAAEYQLSLPVQYWSFAELTNEQLQAAPGLLRLQQLLQQQGSWLTWLNSYYCRIVAFQPVDLSQPSQLSEAQTFISTSQTSPFQNLSESYQALTDFIQHWRGQLVEY
ncbi:DUF6586 family protein [Spartinivicinus ruber]|uniref:DUF6586 family protein n=1 Tax=Spartinivicinus ruber TaxID=2683272 RepID=UPI0013D558BB|nr:DUF6586 family protein [Spartinivicinus ruber]